jgi:hypothetical protein
MSTLKTNNVQVGQSATATNNFTLYQPATPDGTVRLGVGNSGATTADAITVTNAGNVTVLGSLTAASFSGVSALSTASGSAPSYSARAWVNFNGTGTVAIRASGNVSSITDNGTGYYTLNFATAMSDANYSYLAKSTRTTNNTAASTDMNTSAVGVDPATGTLIIKTGFNSGVNTTEDSPNVTVAIFR